MQIKTTMEYNCNIAKTVAETEYFSEQNAQELDAWMLLLGAFCQLIGKIVANTIVEFLSAQLNKMLISLYQVTCSREIAVVLFAAAPT